MHTDSGNNSDSTVPFQKPLLLLLCITMAMDIVSLSRSAMIAKDGVTFIRYAQSLDNHFLETIKNGYQHPGYPVLIRGLHKVAALWSPDHPLRSWILSAQTVSMFCHWIGILLFYAIAKNLTDPQKAFYSTLIFLFLPFPASLAIDALSDWPHMLFFLASLLFLIRGMKKSCLRDYSAAGFLAGLGYLVRPEAAQVIFYACGWLAAAVFLKREKIGKAVILLFCFLILFTIPALPYISYKQSIFPKKNLITPPAVQSDLSGIPHLFSASIQPESRSVNGIFILLQRITEFLFYYFLPFAFLGVWIHLKKGNFRCWEWILVFLVILLNAALLCLLYYQYGYISKRHTFVLSSCLIVFIPLGIEFAAGVFTRHKNSGGDTQQYFYFKLLLWTGICICLPKLLKPLGDDKAHYITIADELKRQTGIHDILAVPDSRIGFYSERQYFDYSHRNKDYLTDAWVELLPDKHYVIHKGAYSPDRVKTSSPSVPPRQN